MAILGYCHPMAAKKPARPKPDAERSVVRRKADGERREAIMKVLGTEEERVAFQAAADAAGMSLSTWLRHVAIKASKKEGGESH
jgi:hypothetical protein